MKKLFSGLANRVINVSGILETTLISLLFTKDSSVKIILRVHQQFEAQQGRATQAQGFYKIIFLFPRFRKSSGSP
jgi:hypothetical protein